ncbi:uncharacterized protein BDV17DRAFT_239803 [Aspergillus undulatus]|uniref:uncharacterized protein n=1 Tax=Aspergillus undulatus TaxID=1810928 RepID=UPI003CCE4277
MSKSVLHVLFSARVICTGCHGISLPHLYHVRSCPHCQSPCFPYLYCKPGVGYFGIDIPQHPCSCTAACIPRCMIRILACISQFLCYHYLSVLRKLLGDQELLSQTRTAFFTCSPSLHTQSQIYLAS